MLSSTTAKLLELAKIPRLSPRQRMEAITLMRELRRNGFTNHEVEVILGGRWKEATIKKYTRGETVKSMEERDKILETFSSFCSEGKTFQDVEDYLAFNNMLESFGVTPETLADFYSKMVTQNLNMSRLFELYHKTEDSEYTIEHLIFGLDNLNELAQHGIIKEGIEELNRGVKKFGGLEGFLKAMVKYYGIKDLERANEIAKQMHEDLLLEIKNIENEMSEKQAESLAYQSFMDVAKALVSEHSFDLRSLKTLMDVAERYGNPSRILEALSMFNSLDQLGQETTIIRSEIEQLNKDKKDREAELESLNRFIEKANRAIGEIEANYSESITLQAISEIIYGKDSVEIEPERLKQISILFLTGVNRYVKQNEVHFSDWVKNVKNLIELAIIGLTKII